MDALPDRPDRLLPASAERLGFARRVDETCVRTYWALREAAWREPRRVRGRRAGRVQLERADRRAQELSRRRYSASAIASISSRRSAAVPLPSNQALAIVRARASGVGDLMMMSSGRLRPNSALTI